MVRTNATTGNVKARIGGYKPLVTGATKNVTSKSKTADTFVQPH
jgi:hypothetical protein